MLRDVANDFNGDGRSDVLWRNSSGTITDWLSASSGFTVVVTAETAAWAETAGRVATGYAASVIGCDAEAGIERTLKPEETALTVHVDRSVRARASDVLPMLA